MLPCSDQYRCSHIQERVPEMLAESGRKHDCSPLKQDMTGADKRIYLREGVQLLSVQFDRRRRSEGIAIALLFKLL